MIRTQINEMLGIKYPVFQGGMAWIADGRLAAAVSKSGGLGIIAAGTDTSCKKAYRYADRSAYYASQSFCR